MIEADQQESSYEEGSSQEVVVELGQANKELIGASFKDGVISGGFGVAEIFCSKGDKLLLLNPQDHSLKMISKVYRGILVKSNKKKQPKTNQLKSQPNPEEIDAQGNSSQNLFDSSVSSREEPVKKKRKRQDNNGRPELTGKTRIIRKIRTLSKKLQGEGSQK